MLAMYEDMASLLSLADSSVNIAAGINPLMPYPGTKIRKRYKDMIDMENFDFLRVEDYGLSPWKRDAGPAMAFMRHMLLLNGRYTARPTKGLKHTTPLTELRADIDRYF